MRFGMIFQEPIDARPGLLPWRRQLTEGARLAHKTFPKAQAEAPVLRSNWLTPSYAFPSRPPEIKANTRMKLSGRDCASRVCDRHGACLVRHGLLIAG